MGTTWQIQLELPPSISPALFETTLAKTLDTLQKSLSVFDPDSEISAFNHGKSHAFHANPLLYEVIEKAFEVSQASDGAFDITAAPLIEAWGFGPQKTEEKPTDAALEQIRQNVGYQHLKFDPQKHLIFKDRTEVTCNLSAIAKGYGVDQLAQLIENKGILNYMVEIGGEIRVGGRNPKGELWQLGIRHPSGGSPYTTLACTDGALATSGDYFNFREIDGKRVSHTIDPRTGQPISHALASVSVWSESCMFADAWATALNVLGPEEGLKLADRLQIAAFFIAHTEDGFRSQASQAWISRGAQ